MRFSIVGPGLVPIPPPGWGAVETVIWELSEALKKIGHHVQVINTANRREILNQINSFSPDFVHIHYDELIDLYPLIPFPRAITSHYGYLEQETKMSPGYLKIVSQFNELKPNVFCLSKGILEKYQELCSIPSDHLFVVPNGIDVDKFKFKVSGSRNDQSLYLAKIENRKRQWSLQEIKSLYFVGPLVDERFTNYESYLGQWSRVMVHEYLTEFGNLVLLSDGEAHPLVVMEALASGLGVVVSEYACANLNLAKNFISVIPESKVADSEFVEHQILANRELSVAQRLEIREYARTFDWSKIIIENYLPSVQTVIQRHKEASNNQRFWGKVLTKFKGQTF